MHHCDTTHTRTHTAFESDPQYRFHSSAKKITNLNAKVRDWAADNVHLIDVADLLKTEKDLVVVVNHLCSCYPVVPRNIVWTPFTHPSHMPMRAIGSQACRCLGKIRPETIDSTQVCVKRSVGQNCRGNPPRRPGRLVRRDPEETGHQ